MLTPGEEDDVAARVRTGKPLPLVDLRIVDEDMAEQPRDGASTGEVVVRAPWLNAEYLKRPQATEELWRGGMMHTGDVGHIDAGGSLQITDRMKDVIKSGGEWVSRWRWKALASAVDGVGEVAAIGIPDPQWGERPLLLVVMAEGHRPSGCRGCDKGGARRCGVRRQPVEMGDARGYPLRRRNREDKRRQDRQEGASARP